MQQDIGRYHGQSQRRPVVGWRANYPPSYRTDFERRWSKQLVRVQVVQQEIDYFNADGSVGRASESSTNSAFELTAAYSDEWKVVDLALIR